MHVHSEANCPACKSGTCVRNHEPARRRGSGKQIEYHICPGCNKRKVILPSGKCKECEGVKYNRLFDRCGICGNDSFIFLIRQDGVNVGECCYHAPIEACVYCKVEKPVAFRESSVSPVCTTCYVNDKQPRYNCAACPAEDIIAAAFRDEKKAEALCGACYEKEKQPRYNCAACSAEDIIAVAFRDEARAQPLCRACYNAEKRPRYTCVRCLAEDIIATSFRDDAKTQPLCKKCHRREKCSCEIPKCAKRKFPKYNDLCTYHFRWTSEFDLLNEYGVGDTNEERIACCARELNLDEAYVLECYRTFTRLKPKERKLLLKKYDS